jgi:hypothetical protein
MKQGLDQIHLYVTEKEYKKLLKLKGKQTWKEFLVGEII